MRSLVIRRFPRPSATLSLALVLLALPLLARYLLGWSGVRGYVSDLAIGGLLLLLLRGRPVWLVVPVLGFWALLCQGTAELVSAMTRMPEARDLYFLADIPFLYRSTGGSGINHPWLAFFLSLGVVLYPLSCRASRPIPARMQSYLFAALLLLLTGHAALSHYAPSEADEWKQINYPHKLLANSVQAGRQLLDNWLPEDPVDGTLDIAGLSRLDLDGTRLVPGSGRARNVLIVALEGVPGAYIASSRRALHSAFAENPMPKLSRWAERAMTTPDYVLHSHQTMRGLYAMLCGDYSKLDTGMPKAFELLNSNTDRNRQCLPAQLQDRGFTTHFLQGAGLQFMSKDKIMPHIGFTRSHGREWFRNTPVVDFSWGMDDQSFFAGALDYVNQLRAQKQPWMLTLLTVGTHQPYAVPVDYLARYPNSKQAAIGFLDDAVDGFLSGLDKQGVLDDTLVVITSDESHGIEGVRLASAWGFNLVLAPEQAALPRLKPGVYGHVDLTASVLDYFAYPVPANLSGRSLFQSYDSGREMMSYTNGMLRHHDGKGTFVECDFRHVCRSYASAGFLSGSARYLGRFAGRPAKLVAQRAEVLDQSILSGQFGRPYRFANRDRVKLQEKAGDDWTSNLVGAQYLALPHASQTTVHLRVRALKLPGKRLQLRLKLKEFDQDIDLGVPAIPALTLSQPIDLSFSFDNPQARKAFSFHLLGQGRGLIEIIEFSVISQPLRRAVVTS